MCPRCAVGKTSQNEVSVIKFNLLEPLLSLRHAHKHTHTHTHALSIHIHTLSHTHTLSHVYTLTHSLSHTHTLTRVHTHTLIHRKKMTLRGSSLLVTSTGKLWSAMLLRPQPMPRMEPWAAWNLKRITGVRTTWLSLTSPLCLPQRTRLGSLRGRGRGYSCV